MYVCVSLFGGDVVGICKSQKSIGPLGAGDPGSREACNMDPRV